MPKPKTPHSEDERASWPNGKRRKPIGWLLRASVKAEGPLDKTGDWVRDVMVVMDGHCVARVLAQEGSQRAIIWWIGSVTRSWHPKNVPPEGPSSN